MNGFFYLKLEGGQSVHGKMLLGFADISKHYSSRTQKLVYHTRMEPTGIGSFMLLTLKDEKTN